MSAEMYGKDSPLPEDTGKATDGVVWVGDAISYAKFKRMHPYYPLNT